MVLVKFDGIVTTFDKLKMNLTKEQAVYCASVFSDYFDRFSRIDEYMREQKLNSMAERPFVLPGMGPEEDLFTDFNMSPADMEFEVMELPQERWDIYLNMISSHSNMTSIPGRCLRLAVLEKKTNKWVGFIRLGSPVINMKPRNEMLAQVFTQQPEWAKRFNDSAMMGFVIVPAQPFGYNYLGGKLLASICTSHEVREIVNKKYGMNLCLFETTSLYGSTKTVSQYDGMKPFIRFKGLTDSDFVPLMHGKPYEDLKEFVESKVGDIVDPESSSKKLKTTMTIIAMTKSALKADKDALSDFNDTISKAKNLTEQKRYYISDYGFKNMIDYVNCKTDKLIPGENHEKHYLVNLIRWWQNKAAGRYATLQTENKLKTDLEVWTSGKEIQIIR